MLAWAGRDLLVGFANALRRYTAEAVGTFCLTFLGCGSAVLGAPAPHARAGALGVALAFGLAATTMTYALGPISGCHMNPAVTIGLAAAGRVGVRDVLPYVTAQIGGAAAAAAMLAVIASGAPDVDPAARLVPNGFGAHSPGHYGLAAAFMTELLTTGVLSLVVIAVSHPQKHVRPAPIAIGMTLTVVHLVSGPVTNTSVNPARSTGPALLLGGWALSQLWLFWAAPIAGAILGALAYRLLQPTPAQLDAR